MAPSIGEINIAFPKLKSQLLLVAQQQEFINALIDTLTTMFCIEAIDLDESDEDDEAEYVSIDSMRIDVAGIESYIRDQGLAAGEYCDCREANNQKLVIKEIAMYAIMLVEGLMGVKAERD